MIFGRMPIGAAEGCILGHSVRFAAGSFKKGRVLTRDDVDQLAAAGIESVYAARLDADDVGEDEAAGAVAGALAGAGVEVAEPFTGRCNLYASQAGIARIDADLIRRINHLHESVTVATVPDHALVEARQMVATVKIIPFAVPQAVVEAARKLLATANAAPVTLSPLRARPVGLVVTRLAGDKPSLIDKGINAVRQRVESLGSTLLDPLVVAHDTHEVAAALAALREQGASPVLILGASAIVDRGDVVPAGLLAAGGDVLHLGMPVDPGNLMMLGRLESEPVIGVPTCARSPKLNGFDWVLQRLLADIEVTPADIMDMGAGGLLTEIPTRPSPRDRTARSELPSPAVQKAPQVAGIVLAAGRSTRMGSRNKLLIPLAGKPMVRHVVEAAKASRLARVIVVTGHDAEAVREAVAGLDVAFIHNPDYAEGLSTSLKAGIRAVSEEDDAALICLGDMPLVTTADINRLIAAFNPAEGRAICIATVAGKRGNPVLWGADFFSRIEQLTGDMGARQIMSDYPEAICEVAMTGEGALIDLDTPEALAHHFQGA
jgi:molybdenum cofactor cytidylyltransferase